MTAQYPRDFTGTARAPCGNLAIAARGPYDFHKSLPSSRDIVVPNDNIKYCVLRTINVRLPCGARTDIVRCPYDGITGFCIMQSCKEIVGATLWLWRP